MRRIFNFLMVFGAVAGLASCASDEPGVMKDNDGNVSFLISLPTMATRAFGDTTICDQLTYTIYDSDDKVVISDTTISAFGKGVTEDNLKIQLVKNQTYRAVFYANNSKSTFAEYDNGNLTVNYDSLKVNSEVDDAFYRSVEFVVDGTMKTVKLYRPFAQVNIGTNDLDSQAVQHIINNITTTLSVKEGLYTKFNLKDSTLVTTSNVDKTLNFSVTGAKKNDDFPVENYDNLLSVYLLVPNARSVINASCSIDNAGLEINQIALDATPVQLNYRTNIYGTLLTSKQDINLIIEPAFKTPDIELGWNGETEMNLSEGDRMLIGVNTTSGLKVSGVGKLTVTDCNIAPTVAGTPAIELAEGAEVELVITNSTLTGAMGGEAVKVPAGAQLTITGSNGKFIGNAGKEYITGINGAQEYSNTTDASFADSGATAIGNTDEDAGKIILSKATKITASGYGRHAFGIGGPNANIEIENSDISYARGGFAQPLCLADPKYGKSEPEGGAAIGVASNGTVTITSSTVSKADGGSKATAIGGNYWSSCVITISDCTMTDIQGGNCSAAIGGSRYNQISASNPAHRISVNISDSNIECKGGDFGAGIGSGYCTYCVAFPADACYISITGDSVIAAVGGKYGAGIGTGFHVGSLSGAIESGVDVTGTKAGTPDFYKAGYTVGQNIGYGVCDPTRELKDVTPEFTVDGVVISYPTIYQ